VDVLDLDDLSWVRDGRGGKRRRGNRLGDVRRCARQAAAAGTAA